jgi:FxsC-like protein
MQTASVLLTRVMPYRFFFSYSWNNRTPALQRFYEDLAEEVRKRVGGDLEAVAFRDRVTMEAGSDWPTALLEALKTSQVLVPLLSVDYIQSDFCGKEFQVFAERTKDLADRIRNTNEVNPHSALPNPGPAPLPLSIRPVIWVPIPDSTTIPEPLSRLQWVDEGLPEVYAERGLESLAKSRSNQDDYQAVVETIGERIVAAAAGDRLPALDRYQSSDEVPNAFAATQPLGRDRSSPDDAVPSVLKTGVRCVFVAPKRAEISELTKIQEGRPQRTNISGYSDVDGWHWLPYQPPTAVEVGSLVQEQVIGLQYREVVLGDEVEPEWEVEEIVRKLGTAAEKDQIVLLIVDAWAGHLKQYEQLLRKVDRTIPLNSSAVLVPWNDQDPDTRKWHDELQRQLRVLFRQRYFGDEPYPFYKPQITSIEEFRNVVPGLLERIRRTIETFRAAQKPIIEPTGATPQVRSSRDHGDE